MAFRHALGDLRQKRPRFHAERAAGEEDHLAGLVRSDGRELAVVAALATI
jgi:hypothetical protein